MPFKIKSVNLQGIRGFNKPEKLALSDGLTLLYGQNGTGKSSMLQSIEWAITGGIPFMKGGDFTHEDAIVNLFNKSKKAIVEIDLSNKDKSMTISRTRKMGSKTALGRQPLEVKIAEIIFKDEEAEIQLKKSLKIDLEGFSQSKYLHQETMREILNAKPEERSQEIDKLIGTFEIREFSKTIDIERRVNLSIKAIQETLDLVKRDKIQFLSNLKRNLQETKTILIKKGNQEQDLAISTILENIKKSRNKVNDLTEKYLTKRDAEISIQPDAQSLNQAQRILLNQLNTIDRARLEAINRINIQKTKIIANSKRYEDLCTQLQDIKQTDALTLKKRIKEIEVDLEKISSRMKEIRQKLVLLPHKRDIYEENILRIGVEKAKLDKINNDYGAPDEIKQKIEKSKEEYIEIQSKLDKLSGQQYLLSIAIEQLETTKTTECPICLRGINNEKLTEELKLKIAKDIAASIKNLRESQKTIQSDRRTLEEKLEENNNLEQTVRDLEKVSITDAEQLRLLVPNFEKENLDQTTEGWETEIKELSTKETELRGEENRINAIVTRLTQLADEVEKIEKELQKTVSSESKGLELLRKVAELNSVLDKRIIEYNDSSQIDNLRITLSSSDDILNYLKDEAQFLASEKELPMVENQIKGLEIRIEKLQAFNSSLQSIKQIAILYEKEAAISELHRLENDINNYYSQIQGHPYFNRIKIVVEKEDPLLFSIRASSILEDTYIPTRFSTAQLNSVALAIFMSYNKQQVGELPIMILDDPTQNMDTIHKEKFAKLISVISLERQVIIATEDDDTKKFLEKHCADTKTYRFGNWTQDGTDIYSS